MGHSLEIDVETRCAIITYRGPIDIDSALQIFAKMASHPLWEPDFARLILYDDGAFGEIDADRMKAFAAQIKERRAKVFSPGAVPPTAHVCVDPVNRIMVKHWLAVIGAMGDEDAKLFESRSEAEDWLAIRRSGDVMS